MRRWKETLLVLGALVLVIQALVLTPLGTTAQENMKPLLTKITNTPADPVPVALQGIGDVNVSGAVQAEQSGTWTVGIDGPVETSQTLATESGHYSYRSSSDGNQRLFTLPQTTDISSLAITASNDNASVRLRLNGDVVFQVGNTNTELPAVTVVPFPQPIPVNEFLVTCHNVVQNCEIEISIAGS